MRAPRPHQSRPRQPVFPEARLPRIDTDLGAPAAHQRCVAHPDRLAVGACPHCERPRCAPDAAQHRDRGCAVCLAPTVAARPPASGIELAVRAGLAGIAAALLGGWIATQYVYEHVFSVLVPGLLGLAVGAAVSAAIRRPPAQLVTLRLVTGATGAVLGTALGFRLVVGGRQSVLHPGSVVAAPYLCAILGSLIWPVLAAPGRPGRRRTS